MPSEQMSERQRRIYAFIVGFMNVHGRPPTNREIGQYMQMPSTGQISHHLKMLEKKGWITKIPRTSRGIQLPHAPEGLSVIGTIAAGEPIDIYAQSLVL